jgi:hypothetical protein
MLNKDDMNLIGSVLERKGVEARDKKNSITHTRMSFEVLISN